MEHYCQHCVARVAADATICPHCARQLTGCAASHQLSYGTVLNDRYYVGAALGEGGFGITYIGFDLNLNMRVAIKEYYPNGFVNRNNTISQDINAPISQDRNQVVAKGCQRFIDEARVLARFADEPGIVGVRDFFRANGTAYIVMHYLDGITLKQYLQSHGNMTPVDTINLLYPVMKSLQVIHQQGIIHRDISPDNIMLVRNSTKLIDFGAARTATGEANKSLSVMLKAGYAPEEQYRSRGKQGPWTDIYALCATIYKCITGITPDDATQRIFDDELQPPSACGVAIAPQHEQVLLKGLQIRSVDRYQSMAELLQDLHAQPEAKSQVFVAPTAAPTAPAAAFDADKTVMGDATAVSAPVAAPATAFDADRTVMGDATAVFAPVAVPAAVFDADKTVMGDATAVSAPVAVPAAVFDADKTVMGDATAVSAPVAAPAAAFDTDKTVMGDATASPVAPPKTPVIAAAPVGQCVPFLQRMGYGVFALPAGLSLLLGGCVVTQTVEEAGAAFALLVLLFGVVSSYNAWRFVTKMQNGLGNAQVKQDVLGMLGLAAVQVLMVHGLLGVLLCLVGDTSAQYGVGIYYMSVRHVDFAQMVCQLYTVSFAALVMGQAATTVVLCKLPKATCKWGALGAILITCLQVAAAMSNLPGQVVLCLPSMWVWTGYATSICYSVSGDWFDTQYEIASFTMVIAVLVVLTVLCIALLVPTLRKQQKQNELISALSK